MVAFRKEVEQRGIIDAVTHWFLSWVVRSRVSFSDYASQFVYVTYLLLHISYFFFFLSFVTIIAIKESSSFERSGCLPFGELSHKTLRKTCLPSVHFCPWGLLHSTGLQLFPLLSNHPWTLGPGSPGRLRDSRKPSSWPSPVLLRAQPHFKPQVPRACEERLDSRLPGGGLQRSISGGARLVLMPRLR